MHVHLLYMYLFAPIAVKIVPPDARPPWGASLLVMPLLQVLSCSNLMEALTDPQIQMKNQDLANSLLQTVQTEPCSPVQVRWLSSGLQCACRGSFWDWDLDLSWTILSLSVEILFCHILGVLHALNKIHLTNYALFLLKHAVGQKSILLHWLIFSYCPPQKIVTSIYLALLDHVFAY